VGACVCLPMLVFKGYYVCVWVCGYKVPARYLLLVPMWRRWRVAAIWRAAAAHIIHRVHERAGEQVAAMVLRARVLSFCCCRRSRTRPAGPAVETLFSPPRGDLVLYCVREWASVCVCVCVCVLARVYKCVWIRVRNVYTIINCEHGGWTAAAYNISSRRY